MSPLSALAFAIFAALGAGIGAALVAAEGQHANPLLFLAPTAVGVFVGGLVASSVRVVSQWERMVVLRLGRFDRIGEPGLRFIVPVVESPIFVEMRVQTVDVAQQQAITQDNVPVVVDGVIFFRVDNAEAAALKVESYRMAISRLAQATLRDVIGRLSLDELLSHQERLEHEIESAVETASAQWGLHVEAIKLEEIDVPEDLKKMMSRQASSEREKRATIIKAEGDRQAAAALAEAATTMATSPGAMQLRVLQTLDGLGPSASNTVVFALPLEVFDALKALGAKLPAKA
ncbi:MAG TPA: SPFH domain-containing protein [Planctomycetota bacterium]|nr:SPFH domain-containing protein [Planctomycetota bacterium]